jgi:hypothetical protein
VVTISPSGANGGALGPHETADACAQRLVAFGGAVLQHRPRVAGQHRVGGHPDALGVEQGRIGETAGKADDAGLAQQLEQFTDGGGFDVLESGGGGALDSGCGHSDTAAGSLVGIAKPGIGAIQWQMDCRVIPLTQALQADGGSTTFVLCNKSLQKCKRGKKPKVA